MYDPDNFQNPLAYSRETRPEPKLGTEGGQESLKEYTMKKITEETKLKEIIPEGWGFEKSRVDTSCHAVLISIKKKQKTLEDYEKVLSRDQEAFADYLKKFFPKQYYSIILEMIADDICDTTKVRDVWLTISETDNVFNYQDKPFGVIWFDTEKHAEQARKLLGSKINYLL